jgi:hypothetical protein
MAQKGQGAVLSVATAAGTNITITGITKANPAVVTATNTLSNGDIVTITGVVGMTEVNNRAFVATAVSGTTFTLKGVDSTNYTTYGSGGVANKQTMTAISQPTQVTGFSGQSSEIDVTHLQSLAKEFQLGLQDFGTVDMRVWLVNSDTGQQKLRSLKEQAASAAFSIVLASGDTAVFMALVKQFSFDGVQPDGAVGGNVSLRITNAPAWFA